MPSLGDPLLMANSSSFQMFRWGQQQGTGGLLKGVPEWYLFSLWVTRRWVRRGRGCWRPPGAGAAEQEGQLSHYKGRKWYLFIGRSSRKTKKHANAETSSLRRPPTRNTATNM